jgi:hypothetical protein
MCTAKGAGGAAIAERKHKMSTLEFRFHVTGSDRKRLVTAIAEVTECAANYKGAPTFAYEADCFTIDKNGTVSFDEQANGEEMEMREQQGVAYDLTLQTNQTLQSRRLLQLRQHCCPAGSMSACMRMRRKPAPRTAGRTFNGSLPIAAGGRSTEC